MRNTLRERGWTRRLRRFFLILLVLPGTVLTVADVSSASARANSEQNASAVATDSQSAIGLSEDELSRLLVIAKDHRGTTDLRLAVEPFTRRDGENMVTVALEDEKGDAFVASWIRLPGATALAVFPNGPSAAVYAVSESSVERVEDMVDGTSEQLSLTSLERDGSQDGSVLHSIRRRQTYVQISCNYTHYPPYHYGSYLIAYAVFSNCVCVCTPPAPAIILATRVNLRVWAGSGFGWFLITSDSDTTVFDFATNATYASSIGWGNTQYHPAPITYANDHKGDMCVPVIGCDTTASWDLSSHYKWPSGQ